VRIGSSARRRSERRRRIWRGTMLENGGRREEGRGEVDVWR